MADVAVPDQANYDFGDNPIPDNFLDETITRATTEHRRAESQIASVQQDFAKIVDANVASNLAQNLIGGYLKPGAAAAVDPDEDEERAMSDEADDSGKPDQGQLIDNMLIDAVHEHSRKESRTDFLESKLHEMFPQDDEAGGTGTTPGGGYDMGTIASNLVSFLHDEQPASLATAATGTASKKARGSTDLSTLQQEIDALTSRVSQLESSNRNLAAEVETLRKSKTELAVESGKCIDELRGMLIQYQKRLRLRI